MAQDPPVVAVIYDHMGEEYDHTWTWEAAQNYVMHEGMTAVAVADDGHMSKEEAQRLYDSEHALYLDCWGAE